MTCHYKQDVWQGWRDQRHFLLWTLHVPVTSLTNDSRLRRFFLLRNLENLSSGTWIQPLVIFTNAKYHCSFVIESSRSLRLTKIIPFNPSRSRYEFKCQQLSNCDVIDMRAASYCDVTLIYSSDFVSMDAFIIRWRCQPGRFSIAAHRHDRHGVYRYVLLRFRGRIEIDRSYGLRYRGSTNHSSADHIVVNSN